MQKAFQVEGVTGAKALGVLGTAHRPGWGGVREGQGDRTLRQGRCQGQIEWDLPLERLGCSAERMELLGRKAGTSWLFSKNLVGLGDPGGRLEQNQG